jgi:hypothetical protein
MKMRIGALVGLEEKLCTGPPWPMRAAIQVAIPKEVQCPLQDAARAQPPPASPKPLNARVRTKFIDMD